MSEKITDIKKLIDVDQMKKDMRFSDTDLTTPMMDQASLYASYAIVSAEASMQVDNFKMYLEIQEAKIDKSIRDAAVEAGDKYTEKKITSMIVGDKRYVSMSKKVNEAKMIAAIAKETLEALKHRRDMLVQIGVTSREEMKGELRIKSYGAAEGERQMKKDRALEIAGGKK